MKARRDGPNSFWLDPRSLKPGEPCSVIRGWEQRKADAQRLKMDYHTFTGASAIVDVWMNGKEWRNRLAENEFLESADWTMAVTLATAVLTATR